MKKILLFTLCLVALFACKKEGGGGKQLYLNKIFFNDLLSEAYTYSSDMKVLRRDMYSTNMGSSNLTGFRLYDYENGLMKKVTGYNKDGVLIDRRDLLYNDAKNITRLDFYGNDATLDNFWMFEYANGLLSKVNMYTPNPNKKTGEWQFTYDAADKLLSIRRYYIVSGTTYLNDSVKFSWSNKTIPAHWDLFEERMIDFPVDRTLVNMFADSYYYYLAGGPPTKSTITLSQKAYNGKGYLTSQQYKIQIDDGFGMSTINTNLKYEYIE